MVGFVWILWIVKADVAVVFVAVVITEVIFFVGDVVAAVYAVTTCCHCSY